MGMWAVIIEFAIPPTTFTHKILINYIPVYDTKIIMLTFGYAFGTSIKEKLMETGMEEFDAVKFFS
jgi:hypothetical protein